MDQTELDLLLGITSPDSGPSDIQKLKSRVAKRRLTSSKSLATATTESAPPPYIEVGPESTRGDTTAACRAQPSSPSSFSTRTLLYEPIAESQPYGLPRDARPIAAREHVGSNERMPHPDSNYASSSSAPAVKAKDFVPAIPPEPHDDLVRRMLENLLASLNGKPVHDVPEQPKIAESNVSSGSETILPVLEEAQLGSIAGDQSMLADGASRRRLRIVTVKSRIPGSHRRRVGYRVVRLAVGGYAADVEEGGETDEPTALDPIAEPPTPFQKHLQCSFPVQALSQVNDLARTDNTLGNHLPSQFRDIFTALSDLSTAVDIANHLRMQLDLPPLSMRTDRVALRRAVAQMRLALYTELVSGLVLPLAPNPTPMTDDEDDKLNVEKISLTPSSLKSMAQTLPSIFPREKYAIKRFLANDDAPYGEPRGKVVWNQGIGKMVGGDPMGPGFRGKVANEGSVHVFVDQYVLCTLQTDSIQSTQPSPR